MDMWAHIYFLIIFIDLAICQYQSCPAITLPGPHCKSHPGPMQPNGCPGVKILCDCPAPVYPPLPGSLCHHEHYINVHGCDAYRISCMQNQPQPVVASPQLSWKTSRISQKVTDDAKADDLIRGMARGRFPTLFNTLMTWMQPSTGRQTQLPTHPRHHRVQYKTNHYAKRQQQHRPQLRLSKYHQQSAPTRHKPVHIISHAQTLPPIVQNRGPQPLHQFLDDLSDQGMQNAVFIKPVETSTPPQFERPHPILRVRHPPTIHSAPPEIPEQSVNPGWLPENPPTTFHLRERHVQPRFQSQSEFDPQPQIEMPQPTEIEFDGLAEMERELQQLKKIREMEQSFEGGNGMLDHIMPQTSTPANVPHTFDDRQVFYQNRNSPTLQTQLQYLTEATYQGQRNTAPSPPSHEKLLDVFGAKPTKMDPRMDPRVDSGMLMDPSAINPNNYVSPLQNADTTLRKVGIQVEHSVPISLPENRQHKTHVLQLNKPRNSADNKDSNPLCCFWAANGECSQNPYWMRTSCSLACGTHDCELEDASSCPVKLSHHCSSVERVKSKKFPPSSCEDISHLCGFWSSIGECWKNPTFMRIHCCVSCETKSQKYSNNLGNRQKRKTKYHHWHHWSNAFIF